MFEFEMISFNKRLFSRIAAIFAIAFIAAFSYGYAQTQPKDTLKPEQSQLNPLQELRSDITSLLDNPDFANSFVGISVISLETGENLIRINDAKNFIPASSLKLFTVSAALDYLGKDFRFSTAMFLDGELLDNGEFKGNVIIRGSGDPSMSSFFYENPVEILDEWAMKLDSAGIRTIRGNLICDDNYFDNVGYAPGWAFDDLVYPYSAQVKAIAINDNKLDIIVEQGDTIGKPARIFYYPDNTFVRIINNVRTVSPNTFSNITPVRECRSNIIELNGQIAFDTLKTAQVKISVTVDMPELYMPNIFREALLRRQIRFYGAVIEIDDYNEKIDYAQLHHFTLHEAPPLSEIIKVVNKHSHNLTAEMVFKTIAKETTGIGSFSKGAEQVLKFASKAGIKSQDINIVDGSGLSRMNLVSPRSFTALLSYIYRSDFKKEFEESLAKPGGNGTLKRRMRHTLAEKNVRAKTGTMNNVSTICGFVTTRDKEELAFSIMMNNQTVPTNLSQNLQDLILMRLASFSRKRK